MTRISGGAGRPASWPIALAAIGVAAMDAALVEPRMVRVPHVTVPVRQHAEALSGVRIAHLSDLHVMGRGWQARTIAAAIEACNRGDVDLVAITGDFIGIGRGVRPALEIVSRLRTDVPRVAVLGNHDHVYGKRYLSPLLDGLRDLGVRVLNNESVSLELRSTPLVVTGVDDGYSMRDDLRGAMGMADGAVPRIVLTHYPEVAEQLRPGEAELSLAGHSHAGQIRVPVLASLVHNGHARTKYAKGLFWVGGNPLFVSGGVGMSGVPLRFLNPPEVPMVTFRAADVAFVRAGSYTTRAAGAARVALGCVLPRPRPGAEPRSGHRLSTLPRERQLLFTRDL